VTTRTSRRSSLLPPHLVTTPHHAHQQFTQGCFNVSKLEGLADAASPAHFEPYSIQKCAGYCRGRGAALNAITPALACHCTSAVPADDARLPDDACEEGKRDGGAAALFYNHADVDSTACRLANVPMSRDSFAFHYNEDFASFDQQGVMTLKMVRAALCVV
jgi:hypothetical protein